MTRRGRIIAAIAGLAGLLLVLAAAGLLTLRSRWFRDKVRDRIVSEVERSTGGRGEIGSFDFNWKTLRAEVRNFVVHGLEPAGKPPLLRVDSVAVGIKIVSLIKKQVDIQYLEVQRPQIYVIVYPDGRTNVPEPRVKRDARPLTATILDLAVDRFEVNNGAIEVENRYKTPFDARGRNFQARFAYEAARPRYLGTMAARPLDFRWGRRGQLPVDVMLDVSIERDRIQVPGGQLASSGSRLSFSGAVTGLGGTPAARFSYRGLANLEDVGRVLGADSEQRGEVHVAGNALWTGVRYEVTGDARAAGAFFRQGSFALRDLRGEAAISITPERIQATRVHAAGSAASGKQSAAFDARVESALLRVDNLDLTGVHVNTLGGVFTGRAALRNYERYRVEGDLAGFELRSLVALYSRQAAPWDGRVSGPVLAEGSLKGGGSPIATARLTISPAGAGPPVNGSIGLAYDGRRGLLDLDRSFLELPSTRLDVAGALGRRLDVRLTSGNLDDLLPALNVKSLPVRLDHGLATFAGAVTGRLEDPLVEGNLALKSFTIEGRRFDTLSAAVRATQNGVAFRNAQVARGALHAQFQGNLGLRQWKPVDAAALSVSGTIQNAAVSELASLAGGNIPATGTLNASAQISGTLADPRIAADIVAVKGAIYDEPYDRIAGKVNYSGQAAQLISAEVRAGAKRLDLNALYHHARGDFRNGALQFELKSNALPLEEIHAIARQRPGLGGTAQVTASGNADVVKGEPRLTGLQADLVAERISLDGQPLGGARLTASTRGGELNTRLESNLAGSTIRGDGQWRLTGDNPGAAKLTFTRVNLGRLEQLIAGTGASRPRRIAGVLEGDAEIKGPMLDPRRWQATVRIPQVRIGPAPTVELPGERQDYVLRAASPIVLTLSNGVLRVSSARLVGRSTDLAVAGSIGFQPRSALDLKVNGRVDLGTLQDFDPDISASGSLVTEATVRGTLDKPQVIGQLEFKGATFNYADVPNGIYNAQGLIRFTGSRATIQHLEGESGGGKVAVKGFIGYGGDEALFRILATAKEVRVRYPQGVSTVADANLNLTGTTGRSTLAGTVTIVRTGFNPHSDFSSILARSVEPVRTPSARTGFLSGLHFDVQIETAPDITFQSTLAQDIQIEANLRLRGTATNPSMLGRINISQGEVVFFGTRYNITQGSISFFNPVRVEPILNIDLETKARGINVTLTVSGPLNKLNMTPRSDPPLQFSEIVALLATGRAPTSNPNVLAQQATAPQSWQQMGASALLGQAIANPVAGRLQRFFGVTRLKIDPTLAGVENNPQARLTLEQQITPNITFTYITNVTNSNPLVVQVEWSISPKWSVIAVRDENGWFGIDFLYKKRF